MVAVAPGRSSPSYSLPFILADGVNYASFALCIYQWQPFRRAELPVRSRFTILAAQARDY